MECCIHLITTENRASRQFYRSFDTNPICNDNGEPCTELSFVNKQQAELVQGRVDSGSELVPGRVDPLTFLTPQTYAHLNDLHVKFSVCVNEGQDKLPSMYFTKDHTKLDLFQI